MSSKSLVLRSIKIQCNINLFQFLFLRSLWQKAIEHVEILWMKKNFFAFFSMKLRRKKVSVFNVGSFYYVLLEDMNWHEIHWWILLRDIWSRIRWFESRLEIFRVRLTCEPIFLMFFYHTMKDKMSKSF